MKFFRSSFMLWVYAVVLALVVMIYQRKTGPTYPLSAERVINGKAYKFKFLRTWGEDSDALIPVNKPEGNYRAYCEYRRFKSYDDWTRVRLEDIEGNIQIRLPQLPPAGKMMYKLIFSDGTHEINITEDPVILRYKGEVPVWVTISHVLLIVMAFVFSTRTGFEAIFKRKNVFIYTIITSAVLLLGGLILGPIMQKYAFDAFWTGWPLGHDLTDNKTAVAFLFWLLAVIMLWRNKEKRLWAILASIVLLVVFLVPHSVLGSEIDFTQQ